MVLESQAMKHIKLVSYYNVEWVDGQWSDLDDIDLNNCDTLDLLLKVSAQKSDNISYEINDSIKDLYETEKKTLSNKIIHKVKPQNNYYGFVDYSKNYK